MLLKSLKLKDFRQFKGNQIIRFATDETKNVTFIMGEIGSGKTSLAQAFTWCLYGKTEFEDSILLCKSTAQSMLPGDEATVRAEIDLTHSGTEYTIISEQIYSKGNDGKIKANGQRRFAIAYKGIDGQQEFVPDLQTDLRMKEILPAELSKYFFFDGERIGSMSKELKKGKSREFADAVKNLLGLSSFTSAMSHLKGHGSSKSVIRNYDEKFDASSDKRITEYTKDIVLCNNEIERLDKRILEIDSEEEFVGDRISDLTESIAQNEGSKELAERRKKLIGKRDSLNNRKNTQVGELLKQFNKNSPSYFAKRLMYDSLNQLSKSTKLDTGIPDIHARTIDYLIGRSKCICGEEIVIGSDRYNELNQLRDFIPPQSLGNLIEAFRSNCENSVKISESFHNDFSGKYADILSFEGDYFDNEEEISDISKKLEGMADVGKLQAELTKYEKQKRDLNLERAKLNQSRGSTGSDLERIEKMRQELTLKDGNNKRIEICKAYAQYLFDFISAEYKIEEERVRGNLEKAIDEIFRTIYDGGFSLSLDEKYNVQVLVNEYEGYNEDIETSTAQSISIIFAFIAGVIKMARESQTPENKMLVSEPYPLVMDAPLSAFDKTRIKSVSAILPEIAEQVIIFIKDTDGEIAEKYLKNRIGSYAIFNKINEFETYIEESGV